MGTIKGREVVAYRLGLDLGTNSIGWCVLDLDADGAPTVGVRDCGVHIFPDGRKPKDKSSNAATRRDARGMRKNRDRRIQRKKRLMNALIRHGLMPEDKNARKKLLTTRVKNKKGRLVKRTVDPYELRARGLDEKLTPHELGRALFHLAQRRGFRSNRISDAGEDDTGAVKSAGKQLAKEIENSARTLGEFLHQRHQDRASVRARPRVTGTKAEYDIYPQRAMIAHEFDELWKAQEPHHPKLLTDEARDDIRCAILFQRPLKPVNAGRCTLEPEEERAPWALPLAQKFRILQDLNHLRLVKKVGSPACALNPEERKILLEVLLTKRSDQKFSDLRKKIGYEATGFFTIESERKTTLKIDKTAHALGDKACFGQKAWLGMGIETQMEIVERLLDKDADDDDVAAWLSDRFGLDDETAKRVTGKRLPQGHCRLSAKALKKIVPELEKEVVNYDEACAKAYPHHSDFRTGEVLDRLPYYAHILDRHVGFGTGKTDDSEEKRYGKIGNPTVHVALRRVEKVVNAIVEAHGPPAEIHVEIARDLPLSGKGRQELESEQENNKKKNDARREWLMERGFPDTYDNRRRLRLWEDLNPDDPLDRRCPYTGEVISCGRLFKEDTDVEIDHILPSSLTLVDSPANLTIAMRYANRAKGNRSPHEAFSNSPTISGHAYNWEEIGARVQTMRKHKRWRFGPDAMERYKAQDGDFLARHLNDTRYISRLASEYLSGLCYPTPVVVTPGHLTAMLRHEWGLDDLLTDHNVASPAVKNRLDHRHHTIDAMVVAATDRPTLQRVATAAARAAEKNLNRLVDGVKPPWPSFRDDLGAALGRIVVSHKPDHNATGELHDQNPYGQVKGRDGSTELVRRKPLVGNNPVGADDIKHQRICDAELLAEIEKRLSVADANLKDVLRELGEERGIRSIRVRYPADDYRVVHHGPDGKYWKAVIPKLNHHVDILALPKGEWIGCTVSLFDAANEEEKRKKCKKLGIAYNEPPPWKAKHPAARRVMRLHRGDMLKLEGPKYDGLYRVYSLEPSAKRVRLVPHNEAGNPDHRHKAPEHKDPFERVLFPYAKFKENRARKVHVDVLGRVRDPGFRAGSKE